MSGLTARPGLDAAALFAPLMFYRKIGLAVSGGPDSLALMLVAAGWAGSTPGAPELIVYTLDHGLRPEAAGEAAMVVREAARLGLVARSLKWDGEKPGSGLQAAARSARYRLIGAAMVADGAEILVTAHHLADQAETVLMRLAHGSGIEGLRGMDRLAFVEGCEIFRPLLEIDPKDLRGVVEAAGLVPADDSSNRDLDYERVRWRQMLPKLAELGLDIGRLGTFARRMADAGSLIGSETEAAHMALVRRPSGTRAELPHGAFAGLAPAVAVSLLVQVLASLSAAGKMPPLGATETLQRRLMIPGRFKPVTLGGCIVESDGKTIAISREGVRKSRAKIDSVVTAN